MLTLANRRLKGTPASLGSCWYYAGNLLLFLLEVKHNRLLALARASASQFAFEILRGRKSCKADFHVSMDPSVPSLFDRCYCTILLRGRHCLVMLLATEESCAAAR